MKNIKTKVAEIQNYFINKITACDFELVNIDFKDTGWVDFKVRIEGFKFDFSISPNRDCIYIYEIDSFMKIYVPDDRLENLKKLIKEREGQARQDKIQSLKEQLQKLTEDNE